MSWNIRHLQGDPLAVHRVVRAAAPDVLCVQEGPRVPGSHGQFARLARACGLHHLAGGRTAGSNAVFTSGRVRTRDVATFTFPLGHWRDNRRGVVLATVQPLSGGPALRVASAHLPTDQGQRLQHVRTLARQLGDFGLPAVLAADLNEGPGGPCWQALEPLVADPAPGAPATYPADGPRHRIDAILTGRGVEVLEYGTWTPDEADVKLASDHRPVVAELRVLSPEKPSDRSGAR
ncbi:endonuclease/exonuclease/phosphatase family protein [Kineosporia succinea]|uniref:Endonuclease/exonuclease/phosphatase family metal-dependent hydrolase n=1 Tax=Kineosporia succinea TaxID=84632 RepID=A0ABT9P6F0_9ACTN|nr:endonuclease/exonuclease/phosphatase family protein [Kineosporia succinea]MDP9828261.1 endonuclease/exonuclease/phosphatase family metal-dependent hydrolase [Kineosporia succinea]